MLNTGTGHWNTPSMKRYIIIRSICTGVMAAPSHLKWRAAAPDRLDHACRQEHALHVPVEIVSGLLLRDAVVHQSAAAAALSFGTCGVQGRQKGCERIRSGGP